MSWRLKRIKQEAALAAAQFSVSRKADVDPDAESWVVIYDFPLPNGFNYKTTDILILLPPSYPQTPPDWFYMDPRLQRRDGSRPPHYFEEIRKALSVEGWAAGSLHIIKNWHPSDDPLTGHSLLTVCQLIQEAFERWLRQ